MRRILLSLPLLLLTILFALPALAGNWGENWGSMIWGSVAAVPSLEGVGVWLLVISLLGAAAWRLRRRSTHAGLMLVLLPLLPLLMAPHYTNWNSFANGEVADAAEVNENFVLAAAALDDFEARVFALEAATRMFLTTDACPAGCNAVEDGYIKLGATGLTTTASSRTLSNPGHGHSHSLQNAPYGGHSGLNSDDFTNPHNPVDMPFTDLFHTPTSLGEHNHTITGSVGAAGVAGDTPQTITGDLEHISLRLCVRSA